MAKCYNCGRKADPVEDKCAGCKHVVCIDCAMAGDHMLDGAHWLALREPGLTEHEPRRKPAKLHSVTGSVTELAKRSERGR